MSSSANKKKPNIGMILLIFFAIIGVISVITCGVKLATKAFDKIKGVETVVDAKNNESEIKTVNLEEKVVEQEPTPSPEPVEKSKTEELNRNPLEVALEKETLAGDLAEAFVPIPEVVGDIDTIAEEPSEEEKEDENARENRKLQIVFLGDSVLDNFRDETGIAYQTAARLEANVYNLGIAGTCASISTENSWYDETWDSTSGLGVAKAVAGKVNPDSFFDCTTKDIIKEHFDDFKNTDIFIIEYGINDFMFGRQLVNPDMLGDPRTYFGALSQMVRTLKDEFPDAKFVMCQPSYVEFFRESGEYVGNTYTLNNGPGTEYNYGEKMELVAKEYGAYLFKFDDNGITMENAAETLLDGIHPNEYGRSVYADNLANFIRENVLNN